MKCDYCDNEAVVHDTAKEGGKYVAKHLCAEHAADHGIEIQVGPSSATLGTVLKATITTGVPGASQQPKCSECGLTFAEFRRSGVLGCPRCYDTFEPQLGPLMERAHEGGLHHVGKVPRQALERSRKQGGGETESPLGDERVLRRRVEELSRQLKEAVKAEQYERAAEIRDELSQTESLLAERRASAGDPRRGAPEGEL